MIKIPGHLPAKMRKMFIKKHLGYCPDDWRSLKELPELPEKEEMNISPVACKPWSINAACTNTYNLCIIDDVIPCAPKECKKVPWPCKKQEEENSMTTINTERDYLKRQLQDASYTKEHEIEKQFRIHNPSQPKTYKELIDTIKNDKFELTKEAKVIDARVEAGEYVGCYGPFSGIKFKMDNAPDFDGFEIAIEEKNKQKTVAERIIMTADAAAGLKALQDFEAWTPVGNA